MELPKNVLDKINLDLAVRRHKNPDKLSWMKRKGKWEDQGCRQSFRSHLRKI